MKATLITRTCKCCSNEFQITGDNNGYKVVRCFYCRMNCGRNECKA